MKNLCFLFLVCLGWTTTQAQQRQFKPFRVELSAGIGVPTSGRVGYLLSLEPKYALNDQISLGLRTESLVIYQKPFGTLTTVGTLAVRSYGVTGDRYFSLGRQNRLALGAVFGLYQYAYGTANEDDYKSLTRDKFSVSQPGLAPRVGLEIKHLRIGIEYTFVLYQSEPTLNYLSTKVGLVIGGGRYRTAPN